MHSILQYFYSGGMEQIVVSVDEPSTTKAEFERLKLYPSQEKVNFNCWFKFNEKRLQEELDSTVAPPVTGKIRAAMRNWGARPNLSGSASTAAPTPQQEENSQRSVVPTPPTTAGSPSSRPPSAGKASRSSIKVRQSVASVKPDTSRSSVAHHGSSRAQTSQGSSRADSRWRRTIQARATRVTPQVTRLAGKKGGHLHPMDAFFHFATHNPPLYCYPPVPREYLQHAKTAQYMDVRYVDFQSRCNSPEREAVLKEKGEVEGDGEQSGNDDDAEDIYNNAVRCTCHQDTDFANYRRKRTGVHVKHADEGDLILEDGPWFPGALFFRFTYEIYTEDPTLCISLGTVPEAQLLFIYSTRSVREVATPKLGGARVPARFKPSPERPLGPGAESDDEDQPFRAFRLTKHKTVAEDLLAKKQSEMLPLLTLVDYY